MGKSDWWQLYTDLLSPYYKVRWYDSCSLAQVKLTPFTQEHLHQQFINGGIDLAVATLLENGLQQSGPPTILAFSIGGTIAWKAVQAGLAAEQFYAVSATRLRYERESLPIEGCLWYGGEDAYRPNTEWLSQQRLSSDILVGGEHECYRDVEVAQHVSELIIGRNESRRYIAGEK